MQKLFDRLNPFRKNATNALKEKNVLSTAIHQSQGKVSLNVSPLRAEGIQFEQGEAAVALST